MNYRPLLVITDDILKAWYWQREHPEYSDYKMKIVSSSDQMRGYRDNPYIKLGKPKDATVEQMMYFEDENFTIL